MLSTLGFVDSADVYGPAVYGPPNQNTLADQYAAMPSLHIGWAVMVAIGIIATTRTRWRWLAVLHPTATTLVVVGTANHFWMDGMVALALLAASLIVVRSLSEPRIDVPAFVPVLASAAVRELPDLPVRMAPPQPRVLAAPRPFIVPVLGAPLLVAPHLVVTDRPGGGGPVSADRPDSGAGGEDLADVAGDSRDR